MKKISTRQLANITGVGIHNLHVYRSRGKLNFIKNGNFNLVDVTDPVNEKFIMEKTNKKGNVVYVADIKPDKTLIKTERNKTVTKVNGKEKKKRLKRKVIIQPISEYEIYRNKKIKADAELAQLKLAQSNGKMIPFDQVQETFTAAFRNLYMEIYNIFDNEMTILVDKLGGTREDMCKIRPKLRDMINKTIERAEEKTEKDIRNISKDFAVKRSRGEVY
ncbi:hypothetical protein ES708_05014 [subsurface metagenome]